MKEKEKLLLQLQLMQQRILYLRRLPYNTFYRPASKKLPFISRFIVETTMTGNAVVQVKSSVSSLLDTGSAGSSLSGLQFGTLALAMLDFYLIPIVYLSALILSEEVPFNLANNTRWLYSALMLSLTLAALFIPGAALLIGLATGITSLSVSTFLLGRAIHERYQLGRERKNIRMQGLIVEHEIDRIQNTAEALKTLLIDTEDPEQIAAIGDKIMRLQEHYNAQKKLMKDLKVQELEVNEKIKEVGLFKIFERCLFVTLGALAIIGLVLSLFNPPVGVMMLTVVSIISLSFIVTRLAVPVFKYLGGLIVDKCSKLFMGKKPESDIDSLEASLEEENQSTNQILTDLTDKAAELEELTELFGSKEYAIEHMNRESGDVKPSSALVMMQQLQNENEKENESTEQDHLGIR